MFRVIPLLLLTSCGVIAWKGGQSVKCDDFGEIYFSELPVEVRERFLKTNYNQENPLFDYEKNIIHLKDSQEALIPVILVIRCHGPLCSRENQNHKGVLLAGYHFNFAGRNYRLKCGNMLPPKIIYGRKLYTTHDYHFISGIQEGKDPIFLIHQESI